MEEEETKVLFSDKRKTVEGEVPPGDYKFVSQTKTGNSRTKDLQEASNKTETLQAEQPLVKPKVKIKGASLDVGDAEEEDTCPICTDSFKLAKLLFCGHTICSSCLLEIANRNPERDRVICPICRKNNLVPPKGIKGFLTNFYVKSLEARRVTCDICGSGAGFGKKMMGCSYCQANLCPTCYKNHNHTGNRGRQSSRLPHFMSVEDENDEDILSENPRHSESLKNLLEELFNKTEINGTVFSAKLIFCFQCEDKGCINRILPTVDNEMWVLVNNSPIIMKYNKHGEVSQRKYVDGKILDIGLHHTFNDKSLLLLVEGVHAVMACTGDQVAEYIDTKDYQPTILNCLNNGSLIVAARLDLPDASSYQSHYVLLFYDSQCNFVNEMRQVGDLPLRQVRSLACNEKIGSLCVADEDNNCVHIIREENTPLLYKRRGNFPVIPRRERQPLESNFCGFQPRMVTFDSAGNIIIYDEAAGVLQMLDSRTKLLGILLPDDEKFFESPSYITTDANGHLLVGDSVSGKIKAYDIDVCYNDLGMADRSMLRIGIMSQLGQRILGPHARETGFDEITNLAQRLDVPVEELLDSILSSSNIE